MVRVGSKGTSEPGGIDEEPGCRSMMADIAIHDRPRERLQREGGPALSDTEIMAVLLRNGHRGRSVLETASRLLAEAGGLSGLMGVSYEQLRTLRLGPTQASVVLAGLELAARLARSQMPERAPMTHPQAVARYLSLQFMVPGQEVMGALYLDSRNRLLAAKEIYRGTLNRAAVEPRSLLKEGLLRDAAGFVLFHTHPSGDPSPSAEDLAFTRRMARSGELLGIRLVDHLIVGGGSSFVSLRERGGW